MNRSFKVTINGEENLVAVNSRSGESFSLTVNGKEVRATVSKASHLQEKQFQGGCSKDDSSATNLIAPYSGVISSLSVLTGDTVNKGAVLLVIEAMKMENQVKSQSDVTIKKIHVNVGDEVTKGDLLIEF